MKIINVDINDEIIFKNVLDVDTGVITGISSSVKLPTGNYNNIILNFSFANQKLCENFNIFASFKINNGTPIVQELAPMEIGNVNYTHTCYIPNEVFEDKCEVTLGVYGYRLNEDETLDQRFSLVPVRNFVIEGSYDPDSTEGIVPTPTVFEIYFDKINKAEEECQAMLQKTATDVETMLNQCEEDYNTFKAEKDAEVNDFLNNAEGQFMGTVQKLETDFAETQALVGEMQTTVDEMEATVDETETTVDNMQGDLYTVDRYNMVEFEQRILEVDYITDILVTETQHTGNCIPQSGWQPIAENNNYVFTSNGWQIKDDWTIGTATNNVTNAFDGDTNTKFQSKNGTGYANIIINCPYPVKITKMKTFIGTTKSSDFSACAIQGYKDGEWINIYNYGSNYQTQLTEIEITNPDYFEQYQIYLSTSSLGNAYIAEIEVSEYYTGVFGIRDYCADLDLPLTSYEKNKKISIEMADKILDSGTGETYIETIDSPLININNKGAKRINGSIQYGRKYELVYNGESWDITTKYVTGSFTLPGDSINSVVIDLGFEPDIVIVYNAYNNYDRVAVNSSGNANYHHVPRILTKAYLSQDNYGYITSTGFTFKGGSGNEPVEYYIAIKF